MSPFSKNLFSTEPMTYTGGSLILPVSITAVLLSKIQCHPIIKRMWVLVLPLT